MFITNNKKIITIKGKKADTSGAEFVIIPIACDDGNNLPTYTIDFGSIFAGNIIPDKRSAGKNIICDIIVSLEMLLTNSPSAVPIIKLAIISIISVAKYKPKLLGNLAPKAIGATTNIIRLTIKMFTKAEMKLLTAAIHKGILPTLYAFLISLPYSSTNGVGAPIIAAIVIAKMDMDWIRVSFAIGFIEVNTVPIKAKKMSGTI